VIPVLIYPDVREAVAWLSAAFGFVERIRIGEHRRAQLQVGDGAVQYNAEDRAGHQWTFSETLADVAPETWGGMSIG